MIKLSAKQQKFLACWNLKLKYLSKAEHNPALNCVYVVQAQP